MGRLHRHDNGPGIYNRGQARDKGSCRKMATVKSQRIVRSNIYIIAYEELATVILMVSWLWPPLQHRSIAASILLLYVRRESCFCHYYRS